MHHQLICQSQSCRWWKWDYMSSYVGRKLDLIDSSNMCRETNESFSVMQGVCCLNVFRGIKSLHTVFNLSNILKNLNLRVSRNDLGCTVVRNLGHKLIFIIPYTSQVLNYTYCITCIASLFQTNLK